MAETTISEIYNKILLLINEEKWLEAHRACLEILRFDPENIKIIRIKIKIEQKVKKINQKAIKSDLKKLDILWKEKKYEELLLNLKKLKPYVSDYPPLNKIILKAESAYKKYQQISQQEYYNEELKKLKQLILEKKFPACLEIIKNLQKKSLGDKNLDTLILTMSNSWIDDEIEKNKDFLQSEKYEEILAFYRNLLNINSRSEKINKLIKIIEKKYHNSQIEQKKDFITRGLCTMKELYSSKQYDKALGAAEEILAIKPNNREAQQIAQKSKKKINISIDQELLSQIKTSHQTLASEYKQNKQDFIKI